MVCTVANLVDAARLKDFVANYELVLDIDYGITSQLGHQLEVGHDVFDVAESTKTSDQCKEHDNLETATAALSLIKDVVIKFFDSHWLIVFIPFCGGSLSVRVHG